LGLLPIGQSAALVFQVRDSEGELYCREVQVPTAEYLTICIPSSPSRHTITGRVKAFNPNGTELPAPPIRFRVTFDRQQEPYLWYDTTTDAQGNYRLIVDLPGRYNIKVEPIQMEIGSAAECLAVEDELFIYSDDDEIELHDFAFTRFEFTEAWAKYCRQTCCQTNPSCSSDCVTVNPSQWQYVFGCRYGDGRGPWLPTQNGRFSGWFLAPGQIESFDFRIAAKDDQGKTGEGNVTLPLPPPGNIPVVCVPEYQVSGQIRFWDPQGRALPVAATQVRIEQLDPPQQRFDVDLDASGRYRVYLPRHGEYFVSARVVQNGVDGGNWCDAILAGPDYLFVQRDYLDYRVDLDFTRFDFSDVWTRDCRDDSVVTTSTWRHAEMGCPGGDGGPFFPTMGGRFEEGQVYVGGKRSEYILRFDGRGGSNSGSGTVAVPGPGLWVVCVPEGSCAEE